MKHKLMIAVMAVFSVVVLASCKKKGGSDALEKLEGFQKSMCECKDKACADKVQADMTTWGAEVAKTAGKQEEKPDPELAKKSADLMAKYTECMSKLTMAGAGGDQKGGADAKAGGAMTAGGKSCEELGGKPDPSSPKVCILSGPAPFEATFTGKFDTTAMKPEPGAVFKVTSKFDRPVKISSAQLYAYDKTGAQVDITAGGSKLKYAQDSSASLIEIAPGETKEFVHSVGKDNVPADSTLQLEFLAWAAADGNAEFSRRIADMDARPKDGWK